MGTQKDIADLASLVSPLHYLTQCVEIPERLGHLLAVDNQVGRVQPVFHERLARGPLALGDLVIMMREQIIHTAGMHIKALAKVLHAHRRALNVPTGTAAPPWGIPHDIAIFLCPRFPQRKVRRALLLVLILGHACPGLQRRGVDAGKTAIVLELGDAEVERPVVRLVGQPFLK